MQFITGCNLPPDAAAKSTGHTTQLKRRNPPQAPSPFATPHPHPIPSSFATPPPSPIPIAHHSPTLAAPPYAVHRSPTLATPPSPIAAAHRSHSSDAAPIAATPPTQPPSATRPPTQHPLQQCTRAGFRMNYCRTPPSCTAIPEVRPRRTPSSALGQLLRSPETTHQRKPQLGSSPEHLARATRTSPAERRLQSGHEASELEPVK